VFKDITPLLVAPEALDAAVVQLAEQVAPLSIDLVVAGFVPARKPGKLPHETLRIEYGLEYGIDSLEVHIDALAPGTRVLLHDDLLATGGTARAVCDLVVRLGATIVGCAFLIELKFLGGRERLAPYPVQALIGYDV
jgi:adenine phosphoribosyltransferase